MVEYNKDIVVSEEDTKEFYSVPDDLSFEYRRITPKCPYCSHNSLYFYAQRPMKIRCAHCSRRFNISLELSFEPNKRPLDEYFQ